MGTIVLYAGAIAGLWLLAGLAFALGFAVGRGFREGSLPVARTDEGNPNERGELSTSTEEIAVAQFSKAAWLTRPLM